MVRRLFNCPQFVMCSLETDQKANPNNLDRTAVLSDHIVTWDELEAHRERGDDFSGLIFGVFVK